MSASPTFVMNRRRFVALSAAGAATAWAGGRGQSAIAADSAVTDLDLIVHQQSPMNAEPALGDLVGSWITPIEHFYIRSHGSTPQIDAATFRLEITGLVDKPLTLSLEELQERFPKVETVATMTCAGNRRIEHSATKKVAGVPWGAGAIGNARWAGVRLSDVLKAAGIKAEAKHIQFEGTDDIDEKGHKINFGASIPLEKAMSDDKGTSGGLLAYEMNQQPLTPDHGFPLRGVVPGFIGARSVKWLRRIVVSDRPSDNHFVSHAYKVVTEDTPEQWDKSKIIYEYPINAAVCTPASESDLKSGRVSVAGYALPPGSPKQLVKSVEVSTDGGKHWMPAKVNSASAPFAWQLWKADVPVDSTTKSITVRTTDTAGNIQPEKTDWNIKGYLYNGWHTVPVAVS